MPSSMYNLLSPLDFMNIYISYRIFHKCFLGKGWKEADTKEHLTKGGDKMAVCLQSFVVTFVGDVPDT